MRSRLPGYRSSQEFLTWKPSIHPIHFVQSQRQFGVVSFSGSLRKAEKVADRKCIGPEITAWRLIGCQTGAFRKGLHQCNGLGDSRVGHVSGLWFGNW